MLSNIGDKSFKQEVAEETEVYRSPVFAMGRFRVFSLFALFPPVIMSLFVFFVPLW
jgi:hypothetical protein